MTDGDREEFASVLAAVFTYYGKPFSPAIFDIYWAGLKGHELRAVKDALGRHARNPDRGQFLPRIADVEAMLGGTTVDAAQVAWTKVDAAVKAAGAWHSVAFDDGLIHRVIEEMGGWIALCATLAKELPFRQNEFVSRYRAYRSRGELPSFPSRLVGRIEAENSVNGYATRDAECLKLIGVRAKAEEVLRLGSRGASAVSIASPLPPLPALERKP